MRIATWNINSLRLRLPLLRNLIAELNPDVICLQETKVPDELFPQKAPAELGYPHVAYKGMKGYNGVAILSRIPLALHGTAPDWCGRGDSRHVAVLLDLASGPVELHDFYIPAGGDIPDREVNPKFAHKLDFVAEATAWFKARPAAGAHRAGGRPQHRAAGARCVEPQAVAGRGQPHAGGNRRPARHAARHASIDALRHFVPEDQKLYTWWSYRNRDWRVSNRGRRLDHVWVSPDLKDGLVSHTILKDARDWPQTSDHVPVCVELEV